MNLTDPLCLDNIKACCVASQLAYSQPTITDPISGESVLIQDRGDCTLIALPGTHDFRDVLRDIDCLRIVTMILGQPCSVHAGFNRTHSALLPSLLTLRDLRAKQILVTGHSKGAAVARRCALALFEKNFPVAGLITFGEPRGGDARYAKISDAALASRSLRITNAADPVPWMPAWLAGNRHCGPEGWLPPSRVNAELPTLGVPASGGSPQLICGPHLWPQLLRSSAEILRVWQLKDHAPLADHHIDNYLRRIDALQ